jgi:site-specific DNA-adenine methylase
MLLGLKSPLRYQNDNAKILHTILRLLPRDATTVVCPFFRGDGLEIGLASRGIHVQGYSSFLHLCEFWKCVIDDAETVYGVAKNFFPLDEDIFYLLQDKLAGEEEDPYIRAGLFFVINRCTETGTVTHGKLQPGYPKFNEYSLHLLKNFRSKRVVVSHCQSHERLIEDSNKFILCCPPHYSPARSLSAVSAAQAEPSNIDHRSLRDVLVKKNNWILFLNYHEDLATMYEGYNTIFIDKHFRETDDSPEFILITNGARDAQI